MKRKVLIYGAGQVGFMVSYILSHQKNIEIVGYVDDNRNMKNKLFDGLPIISNKKDLINLINIGVKGIIVAIGDNHRRLQVSNKLENMGFELINAIHPTAQISKKVIIGKGVIIGSCVNLYVNPIIGNCVFIGPSVTVSHDTIIGDGVLLSAGCLVGARVDINNYAFIGAGATIMPPRWGAASRLKIGSNSVIGAGTVVIRDVPDSAVVAGVPARFLHSNITTDKKDLLIEWTPPTIYEGVPTRFNWVVRNVNNFKLGYKTDIGAFTFINAKHGVVIEDFVQVGSHCSIYSISTIDKKTGPVTLKKNCRVGSHCVVMPGVTIGENAVVGACSFVNADIPDNVIAYGVPAKVMKG